MLQLKALSAIGVEWLRKTTKTLSKLSLDLGPKHEAEMAVYWIATFFESAYNGCLLSYYASCVMVNQFLTLRLNRS